MKSSANQRSENDRFPSTAVDCRRFQSHGLPPTAYSLQPATCRRARAARARAGFTLLEILVATAILMVIVLMVSMVFQQSNGAFQGGVRRVKDQTVLRGILGTIARELIMAVDSDNYPGLTPNSFAAGKVSFAALTGAPDETSGLRAPQMITFTYNNGYVTRKVANISYNSGSETWSAGAESDPVTINPDKKLSAFAFEMVSAPGGGLPLRVDVEARLITSGEDSLVSARSAGPDGEWETKDDIVVGGR